MNHAPNVIAPGLVQRLVSPRTCPIAGELAELLSINCIRVRHAFDPGMISLDMFFLVVGRQEQFALERRIKKSVTTLYFGQKLLF